MRAFLAALLLSACAPALPARADDAVTLRIMTFNVWYGGEQVSLEKIGEAIRAADPDIVGLQEADRNLERIPPGILPRAFRPGGAPCRLLDHILQLADIARPSVALQGTKRLVGAGDLARRPSQEVFDEHRNVVAAVSQRRHADLNNA